MRRALLALLLVGTALAVPSSAQPARERAFARVEGRVLEVGNDLVVRRWALDGFRTLSLTDRRYRVGAPKRAAAMQAVPAE